MLPTKDEVKVFLASNLRRFLPVAPEVETADLRARMNTHDLQGLLEGRWPVGVPYGDLTADVARKAGLYVTSFDGLDLFGKSPESVQPMLNFLSAGGQYGTPQFSRLLGYNEDEIADYLRLMELTGQGDRVYHLYCDMDGVLVDFERGALKYINEAFARMAREGDNGSLLFKAARKAAAAMGYNLDAGECPVATRKHIAKGEGGIPKVRNFSHRLMESNPGYFEGMPWRQDGRALWRAIAPFRPSILTAPIARNSIEGKQRWVARNLGDVPFIAEKNKFRYAGDDNGGRIGLLIDNSEEKTLPFVASGGRAVLHKSTPDTLRGLRGYGFTIPKR